MVAMMADGRLCLRWLELGGPTVTPRTRRGFGKRIMENIIAGQLKGELRFDWRHQGLGCEIALLLACPAVTVRRDDRRARGGGVTMNGEEFRKAISSEQIEIIAKRDLRARQPDTCLMAATGTL